MDGGGGVGKWFLRKIVITRQKFITISRYDTQFMAENEPLRIS